MRRPQRNATTKTDEMIERRSSWMVSPYIRMSHSSSSLATIELIKTQTSTCRSSGHCTFSKQNFSLFFIFSLNTCSICVVLFTFYIFNYQLNILPKKKKNTIFHTTSLEFIFYFLDRNTGSIALLCCCYS